MWGVVGPWTLGWHVADAGSNLDPLAFVPFSL
jgi:hypothetical protein